MYARISGTCITYCGHFVTLLFKQIDKVLNVTSFCILSNGDIQNALTIMSGMYTTQKS